MPLDLSSEEVPADLLENPLDLSPHVDTTAQDQAVAAIKEAISSSKNPAVLVDALVQRFGGADEAGEFVKKLHVPFYTSSMGKSVVDEHLDTYVGVWNGEIGHPGVKEAAQSSDLYITLGYLPADTNSGGFARNLPDDKTIHINPFNVVVSKISNSKLKFPSSIEYADQNTGQRKTMSKHLYQASYSCHNCCSTIYAPAQYSTATTSTAKSSS